MTAHRWIGVLATASLVLTAAYPLAVYFLLDRGDLRLAGLAMLVAVMLRFLAPGAAKVQVMAALAIGVVFAGAITLTNSELVARLYPVAVSVALLIAFGMTLLRPPSMIERIARGAGAVLDAAGKRYTRTVTVVWCGFFVANACIALATAFLASRELWAVYNGLISYVIAGTLLVGERVVRPAFQRRQVTGSASG
ncbi:MAG: hypothetical protein ABL989_04180 [Gammaproteobacteria bacterium]